MTNLRTAAQQALEALEFANANHWWGSLIIEKAITALRAALAQQAEPVQAISECIAVLRPMVKGKFPHEQALDELVGYTAPPQRKQAERFCDTHCTWADHASGCVRAEPAQEPVAWAGCGECDSSFPCHDGKGSCLRLPLPQAEPEPQTCTWQQDGDSDSGVYSTSCRRYFNLEDGTPEDNKMAWCCYCGKKLVQELIAEDEHD